MALADKRNKTIFTKTGDGNDKVEPTKVSELETKFNNGCLLYTSPSPRD